MNCPNCNSEKAYKNGKEPGSGKQKYKCGDCGKSFYDSYEKGPIITKSKPVVGISTPLTIGDIRKLHDVDTRVLEALGKLKKNEFISKDDLIKRIGLRPGYPRLSATIDSYKEYYGKADSKIYWGHPDEIALLKDEGTLY